MDKKKEFELDEDEIFSNEEYKMVLSVVKMGGDALLEIAFDNIGTKKLMCNTASAHMKRL